MFIYTYYDFKTNNIYHWEVINGKRIFYKDQFDRFFYIKDKTKQFNIKDIEGNIVKKIFGTRISIKQYKESGEQLFESDIKEEVKFLHDRYKNIQLKSDINNFNICYLDIEIESGNTFPKPELAEYPVNLITCINKKGEIFTWGNREYTGEKKLQNYWYIPNEERMLGSFISWFRKQKFDIITGWNVNEFDLQYLINRFEKLDIKKTFSPVNIQEGKLKEVKKGRYSDAKYFLKIVGINVLDYMELYKKFTIMFGLLESYSLHFVSKYEGLEGKLELEGHINDAYKTNWNQFVEYNIQDALLAKLLEDKKKFIELTIRLCYESLTPFENVFSSSAVLEGYILKELHKQKMVMPDRREKTIDTWKDFELYKTENELQNVRWEDGEKSFHNFFIKGGHVEAKSGMHKNVLSFDVASLYPTNILQYNISPETKVFNPTKEEIEKKNLIKSPLNGIYYRREKGIFPLIIEKIFKQRKEYKSLMFDAKREGDKGREKFYESQQMILKILMNSVYGVISLRSFHFYDVDNARVITRGGRALIRFLSENTNKYFKQNGHKLLAKLFQTEEIKIENDLVILVDTDSNYLQLSEIKEKYAPKMDLIKFADLIEKKIFNPFFKKLLDVWAKKHNSENRINFDREKVIETILILAKKKYIGKVLKEEDIVLEEPEYSAKGIEIRRSDSPVFVRDKLEETIKRIFDNPNEKDIVKYIKSLYKEFKNKRIEDIAFNKGVSEYTKYAKPIKYYLKQGGLNYKKSVPIHVRASMNYNYMLAKFNLPYMEINDGTKLKYVFVEDKNILSNNILGFIGAYPKEFEKYFNIDYEMQFQKCYISVVQRIFDVLKWGQIDIKDSGKLLEFLI